MQNNPKSAALPAPSESRSAMSRQLTLSSLFCVLALAGLCVVTGARELAGMEAPVAVQAELSPGLLHS